MVKKTVLLFLLKEVALFITCILYHICNFVVSLTNEILKWEKKKLSWAFFVIKDLFKRSAYF